MRFCTLFSGSSGNSIFISSGNTRLLLDAGYSGRTIASALDSIGEDPAKLTAILVSHEHQDHAHGVGVLSRRYDLPVYASGGTWKGMASRIGKIETGNIRRFCAGEEFQIGDIGVRSFGIPHDACEPAAFSFFADDRKVTVATDIGHANPQLLSFLDHSDLLLIESNHDIEMLKNGSYTWVLKNRILGKYGHLSNEAAAGIATHAVRGGTRQFILGHLSEENNLPKLALETVTAGLAAEGCVEGKDYSISVAARYACGDLITL